MKKQVQALTLLYPNGIPTKDYERALRVAAEFSAPTESPAPTPVEKREEPKSLPIYVSQQRREQVRQILSTGRATAHEIADASGIPYPAVLDALRVIGAIEAGHASRADGRQGKRPVLWSLPKERTP